MDDTSEAFEAGLADDAIEDRNERERDTEEEGIAEQRDSLEGGSQDERPRRPHVQYVVFGDGDGQPEAERGTKAGGYTEAPQNREHISKPVSLGKPPVPRREDKRHHEPPQERHINSEVSELQATIARLSEKVRDQASRILKLSKELQDTKDENCTLKRHLELKIAEANTAPAVSAVQSPTLPIGSTPKSPRIDNSYKEKLDDAEKQIKRLFDENEQLIRYKLETDRRVSQLAKLNQSLSKQLYLLETHEKTTKAQMATLLSKAANEERITNQALHSAKYARQLTSLTLNLLVSIASEFLSSQ